MHIVSLRVDARLLSHTTIRVLTIPFTVTTRWWVWTTVRQRLTVGLSMPACPLKPNGRRRRVVRLRTSIPGGDAAPNCDLLNYGICEGKTTPVNSYPQGQSYYEAYDMEGNALEWVADWYRADYYLNAPTDNPQGPEKGQQRSVRSSAFNSGGDQTPAFTRS